MAYGEEGWRQVELNRAQRAAVGQGKGYRWIEDNRAAVDAAIKAALHVTALELVNNRLVTGRAVAAA